MRARAVISSLVVCVWVTGSAQAALYFENFEGGVGGWTHWVDRATVDVSGSVAEGGTALGNVPPDSGANALVAKTGGSGFNGGYFKVVTGLPVGIPLKIDGYWRHPTGTGTGFAQNSEFFELQVIQGSLSYTAGDDITGNVEYKHDFSTAARLNAFNTSPFTGAGPHLISSFFAVTNDGTFTTPTGTVTIVLKDGNSTGSTQLFSEWDDIFITPEPATMTLLGLGAIPLLRRRRLA